MTEKDLGYFKRKLLEKREELVDRVQKTESYGREAESKEESKDIVDKASSSYTKEFMFSLSNSERRMLQMVNEALGRVDRDDFGYCLNCEEDVERKRLEAVPWARLCLSCQELDEKGGLG